MGFLFDLKSRLKSSGIYIAFTLVIFYFGFYAFYGERGIRKYLYPVSYTHLTLPTNSLV